MATTPTSNWSLSIDAVRTSIASVSAFQTWVNKATVADAKERIHITSKPKNGLIYPYVIFIDRQISGAWEYGGFLIHKHRQADLLFEMMKRDAIGTPDDFYDIANHVGDIMVGLMDLCGVANTLGYINEPQYELVDPPHWAEEGEEAAEGPIMATKFRLTWS